MGMETEKSSTSAKNQVHVLVDFNNSNRGVVRALVKDADGPIEVEQSVNMSDGEGHLAIGTIIEISATTFKIQTHWETWQ